MKQLGRKSLALFTALVMAASLCILPAAAEGTLDLANILKISYSYNGTDWTPLELTYAESRWSTVSGPLERSGEFLYLKAEKGESCGDGEVTDLSISWQCASDSPDITACFGFEGVDLGDAVKIPTKYLGEYGDYDDFFVGFKTSLGYPCGFGTYHLGTALSGNAENNTAVAELLPGLLGEYRSGDVSIILWEENGEIRSKISDETQSDGAQAVSSLKEIHYTVSADGTLSRPSFKIGYSVRADFVLGDGGTLTAQDDYTYRTEAGANQGTICKGQVFTMVDPVAAIGNQKYATLAEAVAAVPEGTQTPTTVTLLKDAAGGVVIGNKPVNMVLDLAGHDLSVDKGVGSTGTETNGLQLLRGSKVLIQNGTLKIGAATNIKFIIKNYCDLTLEHVTVDATGMENDGSAVINNCGQLLLKGDGNKVVNTPDEDFGISTGNYHYQETINTIIEGGEIDSVYAEGNAWISGPNAYDGELVKTEIKGGSIGAVGMYTWGNTPALNWQFVISDSATVVENHFAARIGSSYYATLAGAVEAVQEHNTITILEGTFDEPLIINRGVQNVTICGVGEGKTVLTGGLIMTTDQPIPTNPARDIDGLTIKDIAFQGKGIKFEAWWENGSLANITIQNNRFSNIQDGENSAIHFNLSAQLAVENISVLDNVIDGVGTGNTSPSGINISAAKGDVRIENNTVRNTNHSSIQLFNQSAGTLLIQNNRLENWDRDQVGGGRAFRFENLSEDITSAVIRNNCMVPAENFSGEDADIFKISGTAPANLDATRNYWGTATPDFATLVTGGTVKTDPWYKAETMRDQDLSNYVPSSSSSSSSDTTTKPTVDTETKTEGDVKTETVTETVKNKDGSTTTNVTETATNAATGEKTETKATETVAKDGSVTKEEVKTTTAADGTKTEEKNVAISDKATGTETTAQVVTDGTGKTVATARTEARPEAAVKDGAATAAVDQKAAEKLVEQAKAAAEAAKDADRVEAAVVLTAQVPKEEAVTAVSVEVPKAAVESLAKETAAAVVVSTPIADVTLPNSALESLADQKGETVAVKAEKTGDGGVKVAVTVGDQALETVSGGLKASLPVEEAAPGTVAVLVHADGTEEIIRKSVVTDGTAVVPLDGSATIKLVDNGKDFPDTADHWAGEAVEFVTARGLFQGVSDDSFAPGAEMTRGMLVTVLNRLENEPAVAGTPAFPDVTDGAYYAGAVAWAAETGIVTGTGAGFDPEAPITRQTLATILYRYLGTQGADLSLRGDLSAYADGDAVDGWAQEAVAYAVGAGLMTGKDGGVLDPAGTATRAEVAIVLQRMVEGMA